MRRAPVLTLPFPRSVPCAALLLCLFPALGALLLAAPARAGSILPPVLVEVVPEGGRVPLPGASEVALGSLFTAELRALFADPILGWGLDLAFDPGVITLQSVALGPDWTVVGPADGDGLAGAAFETGIVGESLLATLTFSADVLGVTGLMLGVTPLDLTEGFALDPSGFATFAVIDAAVQVVPEPASALLLAAGLAILAGYRPAPLLGADAARRLAACPHGQPSAGLPGG